MRNNPVLVVATLAALVLLLLMAYVCSYLAILNHQPVALGETWTGYEYDYQLKVHRPTFYRVKGRPIELFFEPAAWIDQRLRLDYWEGNCIPRP